MRHEEGMLREELQCPALWSSISEEVTSEQRPEGSEVGVLHTPWDKSKQTDQQQQRLKPSVLGNQRESRSVWLEHSEGGGCSQRAGQRPIKLGIRGPWRVCTTSRYTEKPLENFEQSSAPI